MAMQRVRRALAAVTSRRPMLQTADRASWERGARKAHLRLYCARVGQRASD